MPNAQLGKKKSFFAHNFLSRQNAKGHRRNEDDALRMVLKFTTIKLTQESSKFMIFLSLVQKRSQNFVEFQGKKRPLSKLRR